MKNQDLLKAAEDLRAALTKQALTSKHMANAARLMTGVIGSIKQETPKEYY